MYCGTAEIYNNSLVSPSAGLLELILSFSQAPSVYILQLPSPLTPKQPLPFPTPLLFVIYSLLLLASFFCFGHVFMVLCSCFRSGQSMVLYNLQLSKSSWFPLFLSSAQTLDKESFQTHIYLSPALPLSLFKPGLEPFQMLEVVCNRTSEFCIMDELLQFTLPETVSAFPETPGTLTSFDKMQRQNQKVRANEQHPGNRPKGSKLCHIFLCNLEHTVLTHWFSFSEKKNGHVRSEKDLH